MASRKYVLKPDQFDEYDDYRISKNQFVLHRLLLISFVVEIAYFVITLMMKSSGRLPDVFIDAMYLESQVYVFIVYIILIFTNHFLYKKHSLVVGFFITSFILFQKILIYMLIPNSASSLIYWIILVLIFALYFTDESVNIIVSVSSYLLFIFHLYNTSNLGFFDNAYTWVLTTSLVASIMLTRYNDRVAKQDFHYKSKLLVDHQETKMKLNHDQLTGLYSKYALDSYIEHLDYSTFDSYYLVILDLDDSKSCNAIYGYETGSSYIFTFSNVIRILSETQEDRIARLAGDKFIAILTGYKDKSTIEEKLERCNLMLAEAFVHQHDERFIPHFSYGISILSKKTPYEMAYIEAERMMQVAKDVYKEKTMDYTFYKPYIDYSSLFNAGSITPVVWLANINWRVGYIGENIKSLLGYDNKDLISGKIIYDELIHPDDLERTDKEFKANLKQKLPHYEQIYRLLKADGNYIWIRDYSVPVWRGDDVTQINGYIYDITNEVNAQNIIKEKNQRLSDIIDATNVGTWEYNINTETFTGSEKFAETVGFSGDSFQNTDTGTWIARIHENDRPNFYQALDDHINSRKDHFDVEYRFRHKNGSWIWLHHKGRIIQRNSDGSPAYMVGTQNDITHFKLTEAMLHHSEKLNALGRLSGGIAHDINNQLMMISSIADLAKAKDNVDDYKSYMTSISDLTDRASGIVRQIMTLTKHHLYEPEVMDLGQVLTNLQNVLSHTMKKDIQINLQIPDHPIYINGDISLLENIFINISLNARDAMEHGGTLSISLKEIHIDGIYHTHTGFLEEGDYVIINFTDNGCGISDDTLGMIFEPFFTTKKNGSGIGLSTVASSVKDHQGGIKVISEPGKGTTFSVFLPLASHVTKVEADISTERSYMTETKPTVMIVDDEEIISTVMSEFLELEGCQTLVFEDPLKAVDVYKHEYEHIDIVILDMLMPSMTGEEAFYHMVEINPNIKVLFISGFSQGFEVKLEHKKNVIDFIEKPVKMDRILEILTKVQG